MARVKVTSMVMVYEIDGVETVPYGSVKMAVHSDSYNRDMAVIEVGGVKYRIVRADLRVALDNAGNTND